MYRPIPVLWAKDFMGASRLGTLGFLFESVYWCRRCTFCSRVWLLTVHILTYHHKIPQPPDFRCATPELSWLSSPSNDHVRQILSENRVFVAQHPKINHNFPNISQQPRCSMYIHVWYSGSPDPPRSSHGFSLMNGGKRPGKVEESFEAPKKGPGPAGYSNMAWCYPIHFFLRLQLSPNMSHRVTPYPIFQDSNMACWKMPEDPPKFVHDSTTLVIVNGQSLVDFHEKIPVPRNTSRNASKSNSTITKNSTKIPVDSTKCQ